MKLIVLLVVLALRRLDIVWPSWLRDVNPVHLAMRRWVPQHAGDGPAWLLGVLLPAVLVTLVMAWLDQVAWGLPGWLVGGGLLLWLLGTESEFRQLDELVVRARMDDEEEFGALARDRFAMSDTVASEGYLQRLCRQVSEHEAGTLFATVFFFITLGYGAAVLYVLNRWLANSDAPGHQWAKICDAAFYWLPARLLVLALALGGDFRRVMEAVEARLWQFDEPDLFADAMQAALDVDGDELAPELSSMVPVLEDLQALLLRVLAIWLIFAALWVLLVG